MKLKDVKEGIDEYFDKVDPEILFQKATMKELRELTKQEYAQLLKSGMFWELYPEATGIYEEDCHKGGWGEFHKVEENDIEK